MGDFNTLISPIDKLSRQKLTEKSEKLTDIMNQMNLTDIYRLFHPKEKEYTFSSELHDPSTKLTI
jgi:exonuclease III